MVLIVTFGCVGMLKAESVNFASGIGLEDSTASLACAVDSGCFDGCGGFADSCGAGCGSGLSCGRFHVEGWLDGGFMLNGNQPTSGFHGPYNQTDRHEGSLNQAYLILKRDLDDCSSLSLGGQVDLLYGTDAFLAESKGFERFQDGTSRWNDDHYGLAIPQAYGEVGNDQLSLKVGHFYTIVGYEGVPAVNNFFYSKSLSYMFAGPFVQWGGLATWKPSDRLSFDAGIVNGWDALDRVNDEASFLGRVSLGNDTDALWTSFSIITGDELDNAATAASNRTRYSLIVGSNLTSRLQYVFHHWYGVQEDFLAAGNPAEWFGIDQYLYYDLTPCVRLGGRFEWFRDEDGVRLGLSRPSNPNNNPFVGDMYSLSLGANWTPWCNVTLRPEVRWDWFEGTGSPFNDGTDTQQFLVGMDAIWRF
jgi:putative OmpL-like beta-barrel porin-2